MTDIVIATRMGVPDAQNWADSDRPTRLSTRGSSCQSLLLRKALCYTKEHTNRYHVYPSIRLGRTELRKGVLARREDDDAIERDGVGGRGELIAHHT
jgi:hypothetical protein